MKAELLPCPFCGSLDLTMEEGDTFRWRHIECHGCGVRGPDVRIQTYGIGTQPEWEDTAFENAAKEWNTRV